MYYLESPSTDPYFNLALEQHIFDAFDRRHEYFMLWRNNNAVIVGKHQNTLAEVNAAYVKDNNIAVVRRLSGGGAVYHDLGNINFTFIVTGDSPGGFDFAVFCNPVVRALAGLGVTAEINGRNDMTIQGAKFSGNAQYRKQGRIMHHGTILYDSDLSQVGRALVVSKDKIASKGLKSVRSRVTNVKEHMPGNTTVEHFIKALREAMFEQKELTAICLSEADLEAVNTLRRDVYETWDWNYGASPPCSMVKTRRVEGCGTLQVHMDVQQGKINGLAFFGDYFSNRDSAELAERLTGQPLDPAVLADVLRKAPVDEYFHNLAADALVAILTQ